MRSYFYLVGLHLSHKLHSLCYTRNIISKTKVNFVCNGNVYRSRLAEAYVNSLRSDDFEFSSSGVVSDSDFSNPNDIPKLAEYVAEVCELDLCLSPKRRQTTAEDISSSDFIVCLNRSVFERLTAKFSIDTARLAVWHVPDVADIYLDHNDPNYASGEVRALSVQSFEAIKRSIDEPTS